VNVGPLFQGGYKFSTADILDTFRCKATKFGIVRGLANWHSEDRLIQGAYNSGKPGNLKEFY